MQRAARRGEGEGGLAMANPNRDHRRGHGPKEPRERFAIPLKGFIRGWTWTYPKQPIRKSTSVVRA